MRRVTNLIPGKGMNSWSTSHDATLREVTWHDMPTGKTRPGTHGSDAISYEVSSPSCSIFEAHLTHRLRRSQRERQDRSIAVGDVCTSHANGTRVRAPMTQMTQYANARRKRPRATRENVNDNWTASEASIRSLRLSVTSDSRPCYP